MLFKKGKEKKEMIDIFSKYIDRSEVEDIINKRGDSPVTKKSIHYICLIVKDDDFECLLKNVRDVVTILRKYSCSVSTISGSLIVAYKLEKIDLEMYAEIEKVLSNSVKYLYGYSEAMICNIGSDDCMEYGPVLLQYSEMVHKLSNLKYGEHLSLNEN